MFKLIVFFPYFYVLYNFGSEKPRGDEPIKFVCIYKYVRLSNVGSGNEIARLFEEKTGTGHVQFAISIGAGTF